MNCHLHLTFSCIYLLKTLNNGVKNYNLPHLIWENAVVSVRKEQYIWTTIYGLHWSWKGKKFYEQTKKKVSVRFSFGRQLNIDSTWSIKPSSIFHTNLSAGSYSVAACSGLRLATLSCRPNSQAIRVSTQALSRRQSVAQADLTTDDTSGPPKKPATSDDDRWQWIAPLMHISAHILHTV